MNCEQVKPALLEYALEDVSAADKQAIAMHLKSCGSCREELAELKNTVSLVARAQVTEEPPRKFRMVAEPAMEKGSSFAAFWLNPARLSFAAAGLFCVAIALLALFRTNISYQQGNFQIAFGASAVSSGAPVEGNAEGKLQGREVVPASLSSGSGLNEGQVRQMIAQAVAAAAVEQQTRTDAIAKSVSGQMQQRWQHDLREMAGSMRYFQAAQTMMWKEQVQNQQLVSALIQRGTPADAAPARQ
jgi:hypothetical protein